MKRYHDALITLDKAIIVAKNLEDESIYNVLPSYSEFFYSMGYYYKALSINMELETHQKDSGNLFAYYHTLRHICDCYSKIGLEHESIDYLISLKNSIHEFKHPQIPILELYVESLLMNSQDYVPDDLECSEDEFKRKVLYKNLMLFKMEIVKKKLLK